MQVDQHSLKNGTILNHYKIIRVLGAGGFGITYIAEDISLGMEVVIKEYFPNEFAIRNRDSTIIAKTASGRDFNKGKERFKEEAQVLAKFNHPSIVKILGYFEANNTAYFVMEYEDGIDLAHYLKQENRALTQEEILSIMMPILEGLKEVHKHNYLHRDIKPGNILLRKNKAPILIDFGATKLALGEASKSITSMLTEGYAPLEQYSTNIKQQGPFTDLYAIGAVMYKMITSEVLPSAQTRSYDLLQDGDDPFKPLSTMKLSSTKYDTYFLAAIDRVLSIQAKNRTQTVSEFQSDIVGKLNHKNNDEQGLSNTSNKIGKYIPITIVTLLFIVGGYFYILQNTDITQEIVSETMTEVEKDNSKEELLKIEKELKELKRKNEEEKLQKEREEENRIKEELRKEKKRLEAKKIALEKLAREEATKKAELLRVKEEKERLEKERIANEKKKYTLTINPTPSDAKVYIMNIKPKYKEGMKLKKGRYSIKVKARGYETKEFRISLKKDSHYNIVLSKLAKAPKVTSHSKWITPTNSVCKANGGEMSDYICIANWHAAKAICSASGGRLPTIEELNYEVKHGSKDFVSNGYWSSTSETVYSNKAWAVYFGSDSQYSNFKNLYNSVRCVR